MRIKCFLGLVGVVMSLILLTGCITVNQVVQTGSNTYSVTGRGEDIFSSDGVPAKADGRPVAKRNAYNMGIAKCNALGKSFSSKKEALSRRDGLGSFSDPFVYYYTLEFRCE